MAASRPHPLHRLPGGRRHGPFRTSCWMAEDHLVCVETAWFVERYRRFAFRDIEAVVIQRNDRAHAWAILWAALTLLGAALALPPGAGSGLRLLGAFIALPSLLGFILNAMRGPCCLTTLQTRVSVQNVRAWRRLRAARRAVAELGAAVEAVQGALGESDATAVAADPGAGPEPAAPVDPPRAVPALPPIGEGPGPVPRRGTFTACAVVLLLEATAAGAAIGLRTAPMLVATLGLSFLLFGLCAAALVRGAAGRTTPALRAWTWWLFGYVAVRAAVAYFWGLGRYMATAATGRGRTADWVVLFFDTWAADSRFLAVFFGLVSLLSATLGLLGMMLALRARGVGTGRRARGGPGREA